MLSDFLIAQMRMHNGGEVFLDDSNTSHDNHHRRFRSYGRKRAREKGIHYIHIRSN